MVPPVANAVDERAASTGGDAAVDSVWSVVSAYLHSGTSANGGSEQRSQADRGAPSERVAQVRGLFDQVDAGAVPKVSRGSARDALRSLFTETETAGPARRRGALAASFDQMDAGSTDRAEGVAPSPVDAVIDLREDPIDLRDAQGDLAEASGPEAPTGTAPEAGDAAPVEAPPIPAPSLPPAAAAVLLAGVACPAPAHEAPGVLDVGRADAVGEALVRWYASRHVDGFGPALSTAGAAVRR